jgi:hypothetical protein
VEIVTLVYLQDINGIISVLHVYCGLFRTSDNSLVFQNHATDIRKHGWQNN